MLVSCAKRISHLGTFVTGLSVQTAFDSWIELGCLLTPLDTLCLSTSTSSYLLVFTVESLAHLLYSFSSDLILTWLACFFAKVQPLLPYSQSYLMSWLLPSPSSTASASDTPLKSGFLPFWNHTIYPPVISVKVGVSYSRQSTKTHPNCPQTMGYIYFRGIHHQQQQLFL